MTFEVWHRLDWSRDATAILSATLADVNDVCPACLSQSRRVIEQLDGRMRLCVCVSVTCGLIFSPGNNHIPTQILSAIHADLLAGRGVRLTARKYRVSKDTVLRYKWILKHCGVNLPSRSIGELMKESHE